MSEHEKMSGVLFPGLHMVAHLLPHIAILAKTYPDMTSGFRKGLEKDPDQLRDPALYEALVAYQSVLADLRLAVSRIADIVDPVVDNELQYFSDTAEFEEEVATASERGGRVSRKDLERHLQENRKATKEAIKTVRGRYDEFCELLPDLTKLIMWCDELLTKYKK